MHIESKSRYIRIVGDKRSIDESEIKSIAINTLLSKNSFLICGLNRKACEYFLYDDTFAEIHQEDSEAKIDDYGTYLFEELVYSLFIQAKAIKQHYKQHRPNEVYFNKIKCSLILISARSKDLGSGNIYDVFQGLNSPVEVTLENGVGNLNVLQVDVNDPVQLFNMINVARRLQFEKLGTEKELFHKLFVFEIESVIYNKSIEDCCISKKVENKIYLLDYYYGLNEPTWFIPSKLIKLEDINNSIISFFTDLISMMARTSHFLLEIVSNAIFDNNYSSLIYAQCNGLNLFIDKCNTESISIQNSTSNYWNRFNDYTNCASENTLVSLVIKFHNYYSLFKNNLFLKNEENLEKMSSQCNNLVSDFEDLKLVLFSLSGKIIKHKDLLFNIENTGDLTRLIDNNDSLTCKTPIQFHIISRYLDDWFNESERNKEPILLSLREICQDNYLDESGDLSNNFAPGYKKKLESICIEDNVSMFNSNSELGSESKSCRNKNRLCNLNKSVVGIDNEHSRIKGEKLNFHNRSNGFAEKHTRSYLNIPNYFKLTKCSETPISKILFAVNTARRRVREYRHKQQVNKDLANEFAQGMINSLQSNTVKDMFWNKTLSRRPIFSYNRSISETETNTCNVYSVQDKIEIHAEPQDSKKDVEVQVNNINPESKSKYFSTSCDALHEGNINKADILNKSSIEITKNYQDKSQFFGFNSLNGGVGINSL
ncbi:uncharacterized protein ELE39_001252 [Cryptosporidium sp. chipmunk genotype I]|uniref:uncharacterized protein n=1 Tax=Cryptosporidium sp. chipmunk genotype I TaxID=1280935 RepID=UPI00351A17D2|nr:hypothetical protein ELE39_001252 [Cryptosporidium sp. chipmunk genotype I]